MLKPWVERKFDLDLPSWMAPLVIERVRGAPARLDEKFRDVEADIRFNPSPEKWSIIENAGHLYDLEELWLKRFSEFNESKIELAPADITNPKTHNAKHNESSPEIILKKFRTARDEIIDFLSHQNPDYFSMTSLHPRLKVKMNPVDLMNFIAEHDDYHLAIISELLKS